jgi:hypothetical protein
MARGGKAYQRPSRYHRMTFAEKAHHSRVLVRPRFRCIKCQVLVDDADAPSHAGRCWIDVVMGLFVKVS